MRIAITFAAVAVAISALPADAQRSRWVQLGSTSIAPRTATGTIWLRGTRRSDEVRICLDRGVRFVSRLVLDFNRGVSQRVTVNRTLRSGQCSFSTRLRPAGGDRTLRSAQIEVRRTNGNTWSRFHIEGR